MIKNLLFDLGGVIMDIRRENCVEAMEAIGMTDANEYLGEYVQKGPFANIENGEWDEAMFRNGIRSIIGSDVSDEDIDAAFNAFLIGIPLHRLKELESLHSQFKIYLLSNTNPIMWNSKIAQQFGKDGHDVNHYFDGEVRSYKAGCMKPDKKIFDIVVEKFGIKPEETLFLDDSQRNLDAAAKLGFNTLLVKPGSEFHALLRQNGYING